MAQTDYARVADSGAREEMATGSRRDTREGKGRYDLIPSEGMRRLARHYENGSAKYGDDNWRLGQPFRRMIDSMARHLYRYLDGERDEDHLAAVAWGAFSLMHFEREIAAGRLPAELDDTYGQMIAPLDSPATAAVPCSCGHAMAIHGGDFATECPTCGDHAIRGGDFTMTCACEPTETGLVCTASWRTDCMARIAQARVANQ